MESKEGRRLHGLAAQTRERGEHLEALKLQDEALIVYQKDGDVLGFTEVIADRSLVLRHLADETGDDNFRRLAKGELLGSVEVARGSGDRTTLALPLFNLAKVQEELGELKEAVRNYKEAAEEMENNPPATHNRPSVLADMRIHLTTTEYAAGDKSALERAEQAESNPDIAKYNTDVWLSGAHIRLANILKTDYPEKAKEHLQKAKEIIDANPELTIRKTQWEKLATSF